MIEEPVGERLRTVPGAGIAWRFVIMRRGDGHYFYVEERFWPPADEGEMIELGWRAEWKSGIFVSEEAAEAEILAHLGRGSN